MINRGKLSINDCYSIALPTQVEMAYPLADIKRFEEDYKLPQRMITIALAPVGCENGNQKKMENSGGYERQ